MDLTLGSSISPSPLRLDKQPREIYFRAVATVAEPLVAPDQENETRARDELEPGYLVVCWNDPVNLMDYVTHVFQKVFGWDRQKAEFYVHQLQKYTLQATLERDA